MFRRRIPSASKKAPRNAVSQEGSSSWAFITGVPSTRILDPLRETWNFSQTSAKVGTGVKGSRLLIPSTNCCPSKILVNCSGSRVIVTVILPSDAVKNTVSKFSSNFTNSSILLCMPATPNCAFTATVHSKICRGPCKIFARIPNSSGKLIRGVPDNPIILVFLASIKSR